ncbi:MAG: OmpA family protein [Saprospiraceae bacterium]|nr:OmpA family protein [Saprospiraceae bacterium]MDW8483133.1 OmpA family protein [Saprospiraceae bacterium]
MKLSKKFLRIVLFYLATFHSIIFGQEAADFKRIGEKLFALERWAEAEEALKRYQQKKPGDLGVLSKLGICAYHLHRPQAALQYLEYVLQRSSRAAEPDAHYYYARTLHGLGEYERAITAYKGFLRIVSEKHPLRASVLDNLRRCVSGLKVRHNPEVALVENLGDRVNSPGDEFAPLPSINFPDRLYFSAARQNTTGGLRNEEGYEDPEKGRWCSDMFYTQRTASGWNYATLLSDLLNTPRYEVALDFTNAGQVLYFFRGFTLYSGVVLTDTAGKVAVENRPFESPMKPEEGDTGLFFASDSLLFFASRRPGGLGGLDLYYSLRTDTGWTEARNLGPPINTPYDETTPFLARDGRTLYFSSNRTESIGGLDIFRSVFDLAKQAWSEPVNLGLPINSPGEDAFFRLSADGQVAFFASDRLLDGYGQRDLYAAYFKQAREEQFAQRLLFTQDIQSFALSREAISMRAVALPTIYYQSDADLLRENNRRVFQQVARLANDYPEVRVLVHVHTDPGGAAKFDLYQGIKRAELVARALIEYGVPSQRIILQSFGSAYPVAQNALPDGRPVPEGQQLNRRIEFSFVQLGEPLPFRLTLQARPVPPGLEAYGATSLVERSKGLTFRVEMLSARQLVTDDALNMFSDLMVEGELESGLYRYCTGLVRTYAEAVALAREVKAAGFPEPIVWAYIDGVRLTRAEAANLLKQYPALIPYVRS